jgi:tetratricopeptide (TPR) repeat protein
MKVYRLRISPERAPDVWRVLELSARHTLHDLHDAIQSTFELDDDHLHAFYMSGKHWDKASEIEGPYPGGRKTRTDRVRLVELALTQGKRFSYVFDFGDELWHVIDVESVSESDTPPGKPRILESVGEPPAQYARHGHDPDDMAPDVRALLPLANELVQLLVAEDHVAADADVAQLRAAHRLAMDLARQLEGDGERFWALEAGVDFDLLDLVSTLVFDLARAGLIDEGAELAEAMSFLDPASFLGDRALVLADAGRREEALAQVAQNLEAMDGDLWVELNAGDVYASLGDVSEAEAKFRSALERAEHDHERGGAGQRLSTLLMSQGRETEVAALQAAERARFEREVLMEAERDTVRRLAPKIGRNDPCPCGSGKKHKKCCGI